MPQIPFSPGNLATCEIFLNGRILNSYPEAAEVAYNRGIALYNLGEFDKAETALQDALRPDDPELEAKAKYNLGRCAQANGLEIAAKMQNPGEGETALNDLARAIRFYDEALKLMPEDRAAVIFPSLELVGGSSCPVIAIAQALRSGRRASGE